MQYLFPESHDFWSDRMRLVIGRMIPLQLSILRDEAPDTEPSHAIENFRIAAGLSQGEYHGMVFQDSDVGKWIEAAAYSLALQPDKALEKEIDDIVDLIAAAQQPDGYLNTYFTVKEPGRRWTNLEQCHELYCFGHLTEGAVAYYEATGKRAFLDVMCRMADHIITVIGPEEGKLHGYPGHPECEIALWRLYRATGEKRYLDLARYFIDERGAEPNFFNMEFERNHGKEHFRGMHGLHLEYCQAHRPVRRQRDAVGHAVRALYLYTGMADIARETGDEELYQACLRLWDSAVHRRMYVTGGVGGTHVGEAFLGDWELPGDTAYAETCATIALIFFGNALLHIRRDREVADVMEQALYGGMLSGMSLEADRFFYVNPLEVVRGVSGEAPEWRHVLPDRPRWYACACCPPNMARLITSLPGYALHEEADGLTIHQYVGGTFRTEQADITLDSRYPWEGELRWTVNAHKALTLRVRVPAWAERDARAELDGQPVAMAADEGYLALALGEGAHELRLCLTLRPRVLRAHPRVRDAAGCAAFLWGPVVYCLESCDNPGPLCALKAVPGGITMDESDPAFLGGARRMRIPGAREIRPGDALYSEDIPGDEPVTLTAVPYYAWGNREKGDMRVWIRVAPSAPSGLS